MTTYRILSFTFSNDLSRRLVTTASRRSQIEHKFSQDCRVGALALYDFCLFGPRKHVGFLLIIHADGAVVHPFVTLSDC